ncbi:MAG: histidine phosphatase family protein [Chromatiales bacterium]|nr:histidine phosphatase family protein [Chromatiales bacterium]
MALHPLAAQPAPTGPLIDPARPEREYFRALARLRECARTVGMSNELPVVYLARHGETAWSLTGQHTGLTDLPLTERGERTARRLGERLRELGFARVWTSPLQRALRTCELAGYAAVAEVDPDLVEWDYGQCEGRRTVEIRAQRPDWQLFRDGCPRRDAAAGRRARRPGGTACARFRATCCFFPAGISFGCWRRAGSGSSRRPIAAT